MTEVQPQADSKVGCSPTDVADVKATLAGDAGAYKRIIQRYQSLVSAILWRFTRNHHVHEDLVQETFVQAYFSLKGFKAKAGLDQWLATVATRVGYRYWKRSARPGPIDGLSGTDLARIRRPLERVCASEAAELVHSLLARLSARDRLVLTLRYLEGRSVKQTAALTGWSVTMVKVQTLRARRRLAGLLADYDKESSS